eukprot:TRINITY_DN983_c0_g1_i1.p1 TRINITY_DN983_c0_g1~~TRINITY_DN983_c0_g1_i1.p1  ORF type:complete len:578 (-),score=140.70 TRINITY_DN983_c0_g1_i1:265-1893(-)
MEEIVQQSCPYDEHQLWDVIVIGTGAGGGTFAKELNKLINDSGVEPLKVLILERGGIESFEHFANTFPLPEAQRYYYCNYRKPDFDDKNTDYMGGPFFAVGGKTMVWGNSAPVVQPEDMVNWPPNVVGDLFFRTDSHNKTCYQRAEESLNIRQLSVTPYVEYLTQTLTVNKVLPTDSKWYSNYQAVNWQNSTKALAFMLPSLLWSTSPSVLQLALRKNVCLRLHQNAYKFDYNSSTKVVYAQDTITNKITTYKAKVVVVAAGALESGRILYNSSLPVATRKYLNVGFTDHLMASVVLTVKNTSVFYNQSYAAKVIGRPFSLSGLNYIVDLAINTASFLNVELVEEMSLSFQNGTYFIVPPQCNQAYQLDVEQKYTAALLFLFASKLNDSNFINFSAPITQINMSRQHISPELTSEIYKIANQICDVVGLEPADGSKNITLINQLPGYVAHEGGNIAIGRVLDENLQILGVQNVYVCDASLYASIIPQNPTHMLAAHAIRLADHIFAYFRGGRESSENTSQQEEPAPAGTPVAKEEGEIKSEL